MTDAHTLHRGRRVLRRLLGALVLGAAAHTLICWLILEWGLFLAPSAFLPLFALFWTGHLALVAAGLSGFSERLRDPSLIGPLLWWSTLVLLVSCAFIEQGRFAVMLLFLAILQTGLFHGSGRRFAGLGITCSLGYLAIILGTALLRSPQGLSAELAQWAIFVLMCVVMAQMGREVDLLSDSLARRNLRLRETVQRIRDLAIRDELTGLYNRRFANERLVKVREMAERGGLPAVLAYVDLDHFKQVNDRYGHGLGDEVLRRFAQHLEVALSGRDLGARFGGEEFLLVLMQTTAQEARNTLERLRQSMADARYAGFPELRVTVSIGAAAYCPGESVDTWLRRADEALYRAKDDGRNRVVMAAQEGGTDAAIGTA